MRNKRGVASILAAVALCAPIGAAFALEAATLKSARAYSALPAEPGVESRRVQWGGWDSALHAGDPVGHVQLPPLCQQQEPRVWSELMARRASAELQQALDDELARARYVPRNRSTLAPLEVSAVLNDFAQNLCSTGNGQWHGGFYVQVTWKVRQAGTGKLLFQGTTKGSFATAQPAERPPAYALRDAFAVAARNLLADRRFVAALQPRGSVATVAARD
jgi:serine protease Do